MRLTEAQEGRMYRVVATLEGSRIGGEIRGVLRSKKIKFRGVRHWWFEGEVWEHLVNPAFIVEIDEERRQVY